MAMLAFGVVGAMVAPSLGIGLTAAMGWTIGSMVGAALFPDKKPDVEGPKLTDLKVTNSSYGLGIHIVYGKARIGGNIIDSTDIKETKHSEDVGGKGGKSSQTQNTYTYSVSMAVGICEGPIVGVKRIWANGKLIWSAASDADAATIIAANRSMSQMRVYTGSETQLPDPLLQSIRGVDNTPAYRGLAYIVFEDMQLTDFGNSIPNLEFEVVTSGSINSDLRILSHAATIPGMPFNSNDIYYGNKIISTFDGSVMRVARLWDSYTVNPPANSLPVDLISRDLQYLGTDKRTIYEPYPVAVDPVATSFLFSGFVLQGSAVMTVWSNKLALSYAQPNNQIVYPGCVDYFSNTYGAYSCDFFSPVPAGEYPAGIAISTDHATVIVFSSPTYQGNATKWYQVRFTGQNKQVVIDNQGTVEANAYIQINYQTRSYGNMQGTGTMMALESNGNWLWTGGYGGVVSMEFCADGVLRARNISYTGGAGSTIYGESGVCIFMSKGYYESPEVYIYGRAPTVADTSITLDQVVTDLCSRCGISALSIDVSELTTDIVDGYVVSNNTSIRNAMDPLMQIYFFEATELDGKIKFVKRGKSPSIEIPYTDVAATETNPNELGDDVMFQRLSELEMPKEIALSYMDKDTDYNVNTQYARRTTKSVVEERAISIPVILSNDHAAKVVDSLLYDCWISRNRFSFETGSKWSYLTPTDVIWINKKGMKVPVRLTKVSDGGNGIVKFEAVSEDGSIFNSNATGTASIQGRGDNIQLPGPTIFKMLDIPALRDADAGTQAGMYAVFGGYYSSWTGGGLWESPDKNNWSPTGTIFSSSSVIGNCLSTLGGFSSGFIVDETNKLTVRVPTGMTLSSCTYDQLLSGSNTAVVGNEIIRFRDATLTGTNTYVIGGFLRGLVGTEWEINSHGSTEDFILLETGKVSRITDQLNEVGQQRYFKAVSNSMSVLSAPAYSFIDTGASLKPLSPVLLLGNKQPSGDFQFSWVRRSRIGAGWNNGTEVPIGEVSEKYLIEIASDAAFANVKFSIYVPSTSYTFTSAQQTTYFGSAQTTIYVRVRQVSDVVGPGFPSTVKLQ